MPAPASACSSPGTPCSDRAPSPPANIQVISRPRTEEEKKPDVLPPPEHSHVQHKVKSVAKDGPATSPLLSEEELKQWLRSVRDVPSLHDKEFQEITTENVLEALRRNPVRGKRLRRCCIRA